MKTIGIEFGSTFTKIYIKDGGVFFNEHTSIAYLKNNNKIIAIGNAAEKIIGKAPQEIETINPIEKGIVKNYKAALLFIDYLVNKSLGLLKFLKPEIILSVPIKLSSVELKGFIEIFEEVKVKKIYVIKEPILATIGAKINLNEPRSNLVVHFGGGKCDIGIISLGGLISQEIIKLGGQDLTEGIKEYIENFYEIKINQSNAELIRNRLLNLVINKKNDNEVMQIVGQDSLKNISKMIEIKSSEIRNIVSPYIDEILKGIKEVLKQAPSESIGDFLDKGFYLTGGCAHLRNLDLYIFNEIGVRPFIPEKPELCVLNGLKFVIDNLNFYKESLRLK